MTAPIRPCPYPRCADLEGNPTLTRDGICRYCQPLVKRALRESPRMYVWLHLGMEPGGTGLSDKVSGTKAPPLPIRLAMVAASATYAGVLSQWVNLVRLHEQLPLLTGPVRDGWMVDHAVRLLVPRLSDSCRISPTSALDLAATAAVARRLLTLTRPVHRLARPCPDCDLLSLYREEGTAHIRCAGCGSSWAEEPHESLGRLLALENDVYD